MIPNYFDQVFKSFLCTDEWVTPRIAHYDKSFDLKVISDDDLSITIEDNKCNLFIKILANGFNEIYETYKKEYCFFEPLFTLAHNPLTFGMHLQMINKKNLKGFHKK